MDKEFEKKVKQKRIRTIAVVVVVLAAIVYLIAGTKVEKADYSKSLSKEIEAAQALYDQNKDNIGNDKGQYAAYTLLKFEKDIATARVVAEDEASAYNDKKQAYETLQAQAKAFEKAQNDPVLKAEAVQALMDEGASKDVSTSMKDGKDVSYVVDGKTLKEAVTMNLMVREEGPYYEEINDILAVKKLQGQVISFYQDGSFGGKLSVKAAMYSEDAAEGYVYKVDLEKEKLTFVSKAKIDVEEQTAVFSVKEGGDYVVLTKKIHKDKKEEKDPAEASTEDTTDETGEESQQSESESTGSEESPASSQETTDDGEMDESGDAPSVSLEDVESSDDEATPPADDETLIISLSIRCDTLAADLSKLRDPALEAYVPADGVILSLAEVEVKKGETVYDVLDRVCRDQGIHMEAVYTPSYGADYIEGINYIYEFDAGEQSGWMYMVNGTFPNYGCSDYVLEDGDAITWAYTCDMGKDLGKPM